MLFMIMGVLQMGLLMQARNLTQYSVYRATRAGSVNHGDCIPMMHSAIASLIPSFVSFLGDTSGAGTHGGKLGAVFRRVMNNRFDPGLTQGSSTGYTESILWLVKEKPLGAVLHGMDLNRGEFSDWDSGDDPNGGAGGVDPLRLEVRMVYWYPLRLPLIDWVFSRIVLAQWGLMAYNNTTPYAPTQTATNWSLNGTLGTTTDPLAPDYFNATIKAELMRRYALRQYSFPILVSSRMRMMTPPRVRFFDPPQNLCGFP